MNASPIATLVRAWVDLYTRGLPEEARTVRRDEVEDDLWCQREEATALGRPEASLGAEMLLRLLFGMPADVSWRLSNRGAGGPELQRTDSTGGRVLGVLAILAAASWGMAVALVPVGGAENWTGATGWLMFISTLVGGLAFAGATTGIALRYVDRLGVIGSLGGVFGGIGALFSALGGYQATGLLPIGSAIMAWELGRVGILSRLCAAAHVASALVALILLSGAVTNFEAMVAAPWTVLLVAPYLVSWLFIGISLLGGVPAPRQSDASPDRPL